MKFTNAFGIAAMFTLDPDTPELATVLLLKNIMMSPDPEALSCYLP
jgi:hypothetical protein